MLTYGDGLLDVDLNALLKMHEESRKVLTVTGIQPSWRLGVIDFGKDGSTVIDFREKLKIDMAG